MVSMTTTPKSNPSPRKADDHTYNGWKNYQTWNVALWIDNDVGLNDLAKGHTSYHGFIKYMRECANELRFDEESRIYIETPDGVAWNDGSLDYERLDELIKENSEVLDNEQ